MPIIPPTALKRIDLTDKKDSPNRTGIYPPIEDPTNSPSITKFF